MSFLFTFSPEISVGGPDGDVDHYLNCRNLATEFIGEIWSWSETSVGKYVARPNGTFWTDLVGDVYCNPLNPCWSR